MENRKPLQAVSRNPLKTKDDLALALRQLLEPVRPYYSPGSARLELPGAGAAYAESIAGFEGFSRLMWGLVPLLAGGGAYEEVWNAQLNGIRNGTNPEHPEYWGTLQNYDQRLVETAAIGMGLCLIPGKLWDPLDETDKDRLAGWLSKINSCELWPCNWKFFLVMVNLGLKAVGRPYDRQRMEECLQAIDSYYLDDGWYADGDGGHSDYYGPFAIYYYGLFYSVVMKDEDPERSLRYRAQAESFARQFIAWFAKDGSALPYGRSLSYRFAQSAFWAMAAFAGIGPYPMGVLKGLLLRNLRWWFEQPIFQPDGTLSVGYAYPNLVMAENYNAPGSPYWALKSFLPLAFAEDHPFWTAEELPLPAEEGLKPQAPAHLVLAYRQEDDHVAAFNSGHLASNEHTHTSAKYEKFVYSNRFGFSVPRAEWGLAQGAFDSMLALSEGDNLYRVKRRCEEIDIDASEQRIYARWKPWSNVSVRTWVLPGLPWHVRVHCVDSERSLDAAEGGFALGIGEERRTLESEAESWVCSPYGVSGVRKLLGGGSSQVLFPQSNTNLLHPRTAIPTVRTALPAGRTWLATAVYGAAAAATGNGGVGSCCAGGSPEAWTAPGAAPYAEVSPDGATLSVYRADGTLWLACRLDQ